MYSRKNKQKFKCVCYTCALFGLLLVTQMNLSVISHVSSITTKMGEADSSTVTYSLTESSTMHTSSQLKNKNLRTKKSICGTLQFSPSPLPITGLVSVSASGNTWMRYLLQEVTGLYTGGFYNDPYHRKDFAEGSTDGSVLVVKSHFYAPIGMVPKQYTGRAFALMTTSQDRFKAIMERFERVILLIRKPLNQSISFFNYWKAREAGKYHLFASDVQESLFKKEFPRWLAKDVLYWEELHTVWLTQYHGPLLIVRYEQLKANTKEELIKILQFLGQTLDKKRLECVMNNSEGKYHRKGDHFKHIVNDLLTPKMLQQLAAAEQRISKLIAARQTKRY